LSLYGTESLSDDDTHVFLLILYHLVPQLSVSVTQSSTAGDDEDWDSDDDMMDVDSRVNDITYALVSSLQLTV